jgi:hypothetical protein
VDPNRRRPDCHGRKHERAVGHPIGRAGRAQDGAMA